MKANEKFEYWLDIAGYDLETAEAMLISNRWLYVIFMCQQAVEKLVKETEAKEILTKTKEAFAWLLTLKP